MRTLGLDIGSNSVGSAWIDTDGKIVDMGVSVFPAGVDETEDKRGAPKNQDRRDKRSLRRNIARRAKRKRLLRRLLMRHGLLPDDPQEMEALLARDPWLLRRKGLDEPLTPHEFGRILLHMAQRRGAMGLNIEEPADETEADDESQSEASDGKAAPKGGAGEDEKVKSAIHHTREQMRQEQARTFGELVARVADKRRHVLVDDEGEPRTGPKGEPSAWAEPIRNRADSFEFHADRNMIRDEFAKLWEAQNRMQGELASLLTEDLRLNLDNPEGNRTWRHRGLMFGQRRTYWDTGTLGRCDLEPTDRCVPLADRHASYFRVVESANNIRLRGPQDVDFRPLTAEERDAVIEALRRQKTASPTTVRKALRIDKTALKKQGLPDNAYTLNIERDAERSLNTDWFESQIVRGAIGSDTWATWDESKREGLNRAVLKFDPTIEDDVQRLTEVAGKLGLDSETTARLVKAWRTRPKLENRLNLSRRAVLNLLPYMEQPNADGTWPTQIEARGLFAEDGDASDRKTGTPAPDEQRQRYRIGSRSLRKADRHFMAKHPDGIPPAPTLSNPVVRKAVHEVRRHLVAYVRKYGQKPDRVVIEFAREASKPAKVSDRILSVNRKRDRIRKSIIEEVVKPTFDDTFHTLSNNQLRAAVDRIVLARQQRNVCAYSGEPISDFAAAKGSGLEIDHIIPYSRCGDNSLNNRVVCYRKANRDKGRKTPREWWGEAFDERSAPVRFMRDHKPARDDYFNSREYAAKWRNFSRTDIKDDWRGSQLTDTAYAAREVQAYIQQALWPTEPGHLEGGSRRIFVTRGVYTAQLRRDWQLYQRLLASGPASPDEVRQAAAKNRGDHREHAVDAVAIALTDHSVMQKLAGHAREVELERERAYRAGEEPRHIPRKPIDPPWDTIQSFRHQVLSRLYPQFDEPDGPEGGKALGDPLVVCHRPIARKLVGRLHEDTLFGPVPGNDTLFTGHKPVSQIEPNHLRMPEPETDKQAIERLAERYLDTGIEKDRRRARKRATAIVESPAFSRKHVDPPPGKSGIIRDIGMRRILRKQIEQRLHALGIDADADTFNKSQMNRILKDGPLRMPSGVPIHRVVLLRTMTDPVRIPRKRFDHGQQKWGYEKHPRAMRVYVGGNNHHIEIRADERERWTGTIIPTFEAAQRVRIEHREAVDRSDAPEKGGRFIMSLAEGETVYMKHKDSGVPDYFVVFKLDKPQKIQFKHHWDARRAKGEKDEDGNIIPGSQREAMPVTASQLRDLAPPGFDTPIKVAVDPLGRPRQMEPAPPLQAETGQVNPRILAIARDALAARKAHPDRRPQPDAQPLPGSWTWMRRRLADEGLADLTPQLSVAWRALQAEAV